MKNIRSSYIFFSVILTICHCLIFNQAANAQIVKGSTKEQVIKRFGEPSGVMSTGSEEILSYPGGMIVLIDGIVDQIDDNFEMDIKQRSMEDKYKEAQRAKGLTEYKGEWITKTEKRQIELNREQQQPIRMFKGGGNLVDLKDIIVPGRITIVDFYADWCEPCKKMSPYLEHIAKNDPDVFLRKIDIVQWGTPVTNQYGIRSIPDVRVFDRSGRMVGSPTHDFNQILSYIGRSK